VVLLSWLWAATPLADLPVIGNVVTSHPGIPTIGASGAVFALMGAAMAGLRNRGVNPWRTDIGGLVLLNLGITFFVPGISVGGHIGGLLGGVLAGKLLMVGAEDRRAAAIRVGAIGVAMLVVAVVVGRLILNALTG
jgi:membrane associated rhomboid family serine protease